jgi:hypothetical protein
VKKRERDLFPCLLGFTLLTFECPSELAEWGRDLYCNVFREFLEEEDMSVFYGPGCLPIDFPTFDQVGRKREGRRERERKRERGLKVYFTIFAESFAS